MRKNRLLLTLALLISLVAGYKLLSSQYIPLHDDIHIFRTSEFLSCFKDGQIPCRWSRNLGKGYGYPLFIFYPPLIYAVPSLFTVFGLSIISSLNLFSFLTYPLAAFSMYYLVKSMTGNSRSAFIASVMYTLYPYHSTLTYVRGVYGEAFSWSILPLVLAAFYNLKNKKSYLPGILLSVLLLSHNLSTMLYFPLILLWIVLTLYSQRKNKNYRDLLQTSLINILLGIGLSAFFILPLSLERPLVQSDSLIANYYSYKLHFVGVKQLFLSDFFGYGSSNYGFDDGMSFMLGKPYWILFFLFSLIFISKLVLKKKKNNLFIALSIPLMLISLSLMHIKTEPIWDMLKPLQYLQFPWRLLGIVGFFMIFVISEGISNLKKTYQLAFSILIPIIILYLYLPFFKPEKYLPYTDIDFTSGEFTSSQQDAHLYDYLPTTVNKVPSQIAPSPIYESDNESTSVEQVSWNSNSLTLDINQVYGGAVTFSIFDYPGWQVFIDSNLASHSRDDSTGLIVVNVPAGHHNIELRFKETIFRKLSDLISILSLLSLIYLLKTREK